MGVVLGSGSSPTLSWRSNTTVLIFAMKILVMGLPGSGKTYLTKKLQPLLKSAWYNNDKVREAANDWDFSDEGRLRE